MLDGDSVRPDYPLAAFHRKESAVHRQARKQKSQPVQIGFLHVFWLLNLGSNQGPTD